MNESNLLQETINNLKEYKCVTSEEREIINNAIYLLEKQKTYRWHNLKEDPDDLPSNSINVLVSIKNGCENRTWHDTVGWRNATAKGVRYYKKESVLAWRHIEPFEE